MTTPLRIAMWSGPRNISTAMMRSFGNRPDTSVVDEPYYAAYLALTGLNHPLREAVLASQSTDSRQVEGFLLGPAPGGAPIFYQKHMTHHMLPEISLDWMASCAHAFLIRKPDQVLASYAHIHQEVDLEAIGVVRQRQLFEDECDRRGSAPPVIDAEDVLASPRGILTALCTALGAPFCEAMLSWSAGKRVTDGVWAPAWYDRVERSTGFARPKASRSLDLVEGLRPVAQAAWPHYLALAQHKLSAVPPS